MGMRAPSPDEVAAQQAIEAAAAQEGAQSTPPPTSPVMTPAPQPSPLVQAAANLTQPSGTGATGSWTEPGTTTESKPAMVPPPGWQPGQVPDRGAPAPQVGSVEQQDPVLANALGLGGGIAGGTGTDVTMTVKQGTPLPEGVLEESRQASADYKRRIDQSAKEIDEISKSLDESTVFGQKMRKKWEPLLAKVFQDDENFDETLGRINKAQKRYNDLIQKSSGRVDSNRFWNDRTTGDRIMAGVGIFLGGLGAGSSGQNTALKIIDNAIARDISAQEYNLEQARKEAAAAGIALENEMQIDNWKTQKKLETLTMYDTWLEARAKELETRTMPLTAKNNLAKFVEVQRKFTHTTMIILNL